jgi:hypothetical protein
MSSHYTTFTFKYTYIETEGTRGGVWRICRKGNTAPEDALLFYIMEGEGEEGGRGGGLLISEELLILRLHYVLI